MDFFKFIADAVTLIWDIIVGIIDGFISVFLYIFSSIEFLVSFLGFVPSLISGAIMACIALYVVKLIAGR